MLTCTYCELPIPIENDPEDPYCTRQCFDDHVDEALAIDKAIEASRACDLYSKVIELRNDAEKRIKNLESYGTDRVVKTREYFQSRADVLNDLVAFIGAESGCSCRSHR